MTSFAFPPSYGEVTGQHASFGNGLTFVDFLPQCLERGGIFSRPTFEPYKALIERANQWLAGQPSWDVKTCESVEFKTWGEMVNTEKMTYYERAEYPTWYIRGLRLWLVPRTDVSRPPQLLGYTNLVPEILPGTGGLFGMPQFESLNDLLQRFNQGLITNPLPGRVIAIESQEMKIPNFSTFDPDRSFWSEHGDHAKHFVFIVRVFFEMAPELQMEKIGVADFVPVALTEGGFFTMPQFEPFSNVVSRASQWCAQQSCLRFCNAQSVEVKMKSGYVVDTQRMSYTEHGGRTTCYVRVLRVTYVKTNENVDNNGAATYNNPQDAPPLQLNCKTFVPLQLTRGFFVPEFETLSKTKERIEAWIKATGARVLSCETQPMRLYTGGEAYQGAESSFTYNISNRNEYWIFVIRVFLDGFYHEPPTEMLPAEPMVQAQDCCVIV